MAFSAAVTSNVLEGRGGIPTSERAVFGTIGIDGSSSSDLRWHHGKEEFINDEASNRVRSRVRRQLWASVYIYDNFNLKGKIRPC